MNLFTPTNVFHKGRFANRNSETLTETGHDRVRGAKQNGAFSRKSIRTFGQRAQEPNKTFGSVQAGRFESARVAMCIGSFGLQDAASTSALLCLFFSYVIFEIVELYSVDFVFSISELQAITIPSISPFHGVVRRSERSIFCS